MGQFLSFFLPFLFPAQPAPTADEDDEDETLLLLKPSNELMASAFVRDISSSISFKDHFCGHLPPSIGALCLKYLEMDNAFHLESTEYLDAELDIECVSSPFGAVNRESEDVLFRIHVNVEPLNPSHFEIECGLELFAVPEAVSSITVRYTVREHSMCMIYTELTTMRTGSDLVGPGPATLFIENQQQPMPLLFDATVNVLLFDGVPFEKWMPPIEDYEDDDDDDSSS